MSARVRADQRWKVGPPTRPADLVVEGWLRADGEPEWVGLSVLPEGPKLTPRQQVDAVWETAWIWSTRDSLPKNERSAMSMHMRLDGTWVINWNKRLITDGGWRSAVWIIDRWWSASLYWWRMAWRALRRKG